MRYVKTAKALAVLFLLILCNGCFSDAAEKRTKEIKGAGNFYAVTPVDLRYSYVLIVAEKPAFTNGLVRTVANHLYRGPVLFSIVDEEGIQDIEEDFWDGIIIVTSPRDDAFPEPVNEFLVRQKYPRRTSLVLTTDSGKWNGVPDRDIDVLVTTARPRDIDKVCGKIIRKIDTVILK